MSIARSGARRQALVTFALMSIAVSTVAAQQPSPARPDLRPGDAAIDARRVQTGSWHVRYYRVRHIVAAPVFDANALEIVLDALSFFGRDGAELRFRRVAPTPTQAAGR